MLATAKDKPMSHRILPAVLVLAGLLVGLWSRTSAQDPQAKFRVEVQLVQLDVAVTDAQGNYITGLKPENFSITEDRIGQKIAIFGEGNLQARRVGDLGNEPAGASSPVPAVPPVSPSASDSPETQASAAA